MKIPVTIYVPKTTSPAKLKAVKQFGGSLVYHGEDCVEAEVKARNVAEVGIFFNLVQRQVSENLTRQ